MLSGAEQVFVGRILDSSDGRLVIAVEEVWKGAPVEGLVRMGVDLPGWSEWAGPDGEVPDGFRSPDRWVFAPHESKVGPCTSWRVTTAFLAEHAPPDPQPPVEDGALGHAGEARPGTGASAAELTGYAGAGLGTGTLASVLALTLLRRRSPRRRSRRHPG